jgi:hypothetical protein
MNRNATSPGNAGSRGSEGRPNSGATGENSTQSEGNRRAPEADTDLRKDEARGGGGAASNSSRSKDVDMEASDEGLE